MSIASKLTKLETDITNAYDTIQTKGGTIPSDKNTDNLSTAINSIPSGEIFTGYKLIASGHEDNSNRAILTLDLGTKEGDLIFAQLQADSSLNQSAGFYEVISYNIPNNVNFPKWKENAKHTFMAGWHIRTTGQTGITYIGLTNTSDGYYLDTSDNHYKLSFSRTSSSYPIKTGTWDWYVYKYESNS